MIAALCAALMLLTGAAAAYATIPEPQKTWRNDDGLAPAFYDGGVTTAIAPQGTPSNLGRSEVGWVTNYANQGLTADMRITTNLGDTNGPFMIVAQAHGPRGSASNQIWSWPAWSIQAKRGRWFLAIGDPALGTEAWIDLGPYYDGATMNVRVQVWYATNNRGAIHVYVDGRHVGGRDNVTTIQPDHYAGLDFRTGAYTRPLDGPMPNWTRTVRVHDLKVTTTR